MNKAISDYMSNQGRKGGQVKSKAKAKASAANGAKGGRPRKVYQIEHDNGTDGGTWLRAYCDYDEIKDEYKGRKAASAVAKQARIDYPEIRFRIVER